MNKKVLSLVLALAIVLGSFGTVALASNTEVAYNSQAQKIQWLIDNNHVEGRKVNADGSADLALEDNVTRAEITKLLVHLLGKADLADVLKGVMRPFPDVTIEHWANGYVSVATTTRANAANENRIVIGFPDGKFYPENNVTYAELATMLVRIAKDDLTTKMEADSIWATSYMRWADEEGILEGLTITNSDKAITRADAFEMIYNTFFKMGSVNEVNFGDDLGIVSRLGNGEIQLNQDAKRVYKIDSNTLLTDGTTWKSLLDNIDAPLRGSLVRLIVDKDGRVSHLIELGNREELAIGRKVAAGGENPVWRGVSTHTAEGKAIFKVVKDKYVDITVAGTPAEINSSTRLFVADVNQNALKEVESVAEAFNLFGIDGYEIEEVYMGYNRVSGTNPYNEAKVIVFNAVDKYFGQKETVRVTGGLNSLYRFEAENTKGARKAYDMSNLPIFPSNDLLGVLDVVTVNDNTNVQYASQLVRIDHSEDDVYRVVETGNREIKLADKDGYARTARVSRDALIFLEGQLKKDAHVQVDFNKTNTEIEIISVVNVPLKGILEDGVRVGQDRGYVVEVAENNGVYTVTIADRTKLADGTYRYTNHRSYIVADTDRAFFGRTDRKGTEIVFDVANKFGDTDVMFNVAAYTSDLDRDLAAATAAVVRFENNPTAANKAEAQRLVDLLVRNADQAALQKRIDAVEVVQPNAEAFLDHVKTLPGAKAINDSTSVQELNAFQTQYDRALELYNNLTDEEKALEAVKTAKERYLDVNPQKIEDKIEELNRKEAKTELDNYITNVNDSLTSNNLVADQALSDAIAVAKAVSGNADSTAAQLEAAEVELRAQWDAFLARI